MTTTPEAGTEVLIVAGFGRCGSSLVMQMLHAGGVKCHGAPPAFEDVEHSEVFAMTTDWLAAQSGKAIKVLDPHLGQHVRFDSVPRCVIWLDRDRIEQAKSFAKFGRLILGLPFGRSQTRMLAAQLKADRPNALGALRTDRCHWLRLTFEELIDSPKPTAEKLAAFLNGRFSFDAAKASSVVHKRSAKCLPHLLEVELLEAHQ